jgi:pyridoxine 4-dehydrogenase
VTDLEDSTFPLAGRPVRRIGFGAMQLPGPGVWGPPRDRDEAIAVLRRAIELGVNHIDTAQYYGPDVSNELIHAALHPYPDDLVLVSKVGAVRNASGGWLPAQEPAQLRAGVEANLRSLAVDRIDAVNLRLLDRGEGPATDFDAQLEQLAALRDEGKIGGVGLSNVSLDQVEQALKHTPIACVQNAFNLLDRTDEPLVGLCAERQIPYVPFFPLGSAFAGLPKVTEHPEVIAVAGRLGATPSQVGLAWLLGHDENILLIPGTSGRSHLEENVAAGRLILDPETVGTLDAIAG